MSKCRLQNIAIVAIVWHSCRVTLKTRWGFLNLRCVTNDSLLLFVFVVIW